jgi:hypothetical protein
MRRLFLAILMACSFTCIALAQGNPAPAANAAGRGAPASLPPITTTDYRK